MNETIIKADRRGRLRYAAEHKQALIEAYQASGLSGPKFAELHGVPYQTLISWLKKRRAVSAGHPVLASLVPAELEGEQCHHASDPPLQILLAGGMKIVIHAPSQVATAAMLLRELQPFLIC